MADEIEPGDTIEERQEEPSVSSSSSNNKNKKVSWKKMMRFDSLDIEARNFPDHNSGNDQKEVDWWTILTLAFQSIGIVYGDLGTSPLYVYAGTFPNGVKHRDDILGAFSIIFSTITLITLVKYVFIVLRATDNGEGRTFALYSLLCRYAKVGFTPSEQAEDRDISTFQLELPNRRLKRATRVREMLENSKFAKYLLLLCTMLGTSMLIGDGIFTPCISVLSAVGGIKEATSAMIQDRIVWISVVILIVLFMVQRFGTDKVGYTFAPVLSLWFVLIGGIGIYNFIKYDPTILKAINPIYIINYFKRDPKDAWISLGGTVLCITGAEALFSDVGHFTVKSIRISTCVATYPAILFACIGQSAFLFKHPDCVTDAFYKSVPGPLYWPMFIVAVLAAVIASQSLISGTFSIIQQSLSLGCFPRVRIVHTSPKHKGQVYVPEINYVLMVVCIAVTLGFRSATQIGNAYGLAVVFVMTITSCFMVLIMITIWKTHMFLIILYCITIGAMELVYLSSVLYKFDQGGYLPFAFVAVLMFIMFIWNDVYQRKYYYELHNKIPSQQLKEIVNDPKIQRFPGIGIFYSELVQGIPPIFKHYVENVPALHSILVFVSIKSLPISKVPAEERFLFRRVEPNERNVFRCVARYGYRDHRDEQQPFEQILVEKLKDFIEVSFWSSQVVRGNNRVLPQPVEGEVEPNDELAIDDEEKERNERLLKSEIEAADKAASDGVVHLIGESEVVASEGAGIGKRILIDSAYNFLKRNLSESHICFDIPHKRMVKVGLTYEL